MGKARKLKIGLFFTNTNRDYNKSAASTWIRIWQMIDIYRGLGAKVYFNNPFIRYDIAIVYRKSKKKYFQIIKFLKWTSKTVYFDTCINLFDIHEEIGEERLEYAHKIAKTTNGIICASKQIAEFTKPYANNVFVMEDPINIDHFKTVKKNINFDNPVFGWSGVGHKAHYLNRFSDRINDRIVIITEEGIKKATLDFKFQYIRWKYETFPTDLLKCDLAILPRNVSDTYNQGHSVFKALVFAVCGIPIVANKVPSYIGLTQFYDGIVFLEDYNDDLNQCIDELKTRSFDTTKVRDYYSRENQASIILNKLKKQLH